MSDMSLRCPVYFCPESREIECPDHGGFDVCCPNPDAHRPMPAALTVKQVSDLLSEVQRLEHQAHQRAVEDILSIIRSLPLGYRPGDVADHLADIRGYM